MGRHGPALAIAAAVASLAAAAPAAACGYHRHARGAHNARGVRPPLLLGDSTSIYATPVLGHLGVEADATECRQFADGLRILASRRANHTLPRVGILALGANAPVGDSSIERAVSIMGSHGILALVTPRNLATSADAMRRAARAHPLHVVLIDWARYSAGHDEWFAGDGLHVNFTGARAFAHLIRRAVAAPIESPPADLPHSSAHSPGTDCGSLVRFGRALRVYVLRGKERTSCAAARSLVRRPPLGAIAGWHVYDYLRTAGPLWVDLYVSRDGRSAVGAALDEPDQPATGAGDRGARHHVRARPRPF